MTLKDDVMAHMPYLQLYFADWRNNAKLKRCSHELRGIWLEVMGLMHDSEEYGVLRWPLKDIAHAVGTSTAKLLQLRSYGVLKGAAQGETCEPMNYQPRKSGRKLGGVVCILPAQGGDIWYCSRMVRDDHVRKVKAAASAAPKVEPNNAPMPPIGAAISATPMPAPNHAPPSCAVTRIQNPESRSLLKEKEEIGGCNSASSERAQAPAPPPPLPDGPTPTPIPIGRSEQFARQRGAPIACIPPDWDPSPSLQAQIRTSAAMRPMTPADVQAFRDHYLATGEACADWDAKARTWMQRQARFDAEKSQQGRGAASANAAAASGDRPPKPGMVRGKSGNWIDPLKDFHDVDYEADVARLAARRNAAQAQKTDTEPEPTE